MTLKTTDRERILLDIIRYLYMTQVFLTPYGRDWPAFFNDEGAFPRAFFNRWRDARPGDLAMATSGPTDISMVGFIEEVRGNGEYMVRPLGETRLVHWSNVTFVAIENMLPADMLDGDRWKFYQKAEKACIKLWDRYEYRFRDVEFAPEGTATIVVSAHSWRIDSLPDHLKAMRVPMAWTPKTTQKAIRDTLRRHLADLESRTTEETA